MFELEQHIANWRHEMFLTGIKNPETLDELEGHLRDHIANLKAGLGDGDAFHTAVAQLGASDILKREFAKTRRWFPRDNPRELNFLGAWFVLAGSGVVLSNIRFAQMIWWLSNATLRTYVVISFGLLFGLQMFVGIGLLRRRNFWRYCAFLFAALGSLSDAYSLLFGTAAHAAAHTESYFVAMGLLVPMRYQFTADLCEAAVLLWGCWLLTRPEVKNLFLRGAKIQTA